MLYYFNSFPNILENSTSRYIFRRVTAAGYPPYSQRTYSVLPDNHLLMYLSTHLSREGFKAEEKEYQHKVTASASKCNETYVVSRTLNNL